MPAGIDVVVLAYGDWQLTESCLRHLAAQTAEHRVIVVDNGTRNETAASLRDDWPAVQVVTLAESRPYTQAVNEGVRAGDGDLVVLLNNDVDLFADCLELLAAPLEADPALGSAASAMLTPGGQSIDSVGVTTDVTLAGFARLHGLDRSHAGDAWPLLSGPEGTAGVYRRAAWEQVGGLDEHIEAYMEILDLAWRLRTAGWETTVVPQAAGIHLGSATFGKRSARQRRLAGFSRGYLLRRYGVLAGRHGPRTLLTEMLVVAADATIARDLEALRGRVRGWRAARGLERRPRPPREAIDTTISLRDSFALRRATVGKPPKQS